MKIRDVRPGTTVTIKEGPARGRKVDVVLAAPGANKVAIIGHSDGQGSVVRGDLEVE